MLLAHICQSPFTYLTYRFTYLTAHWFISKLESHFISWMEELISTDKVFHLWHRCHNFSSGRTCLCIPFTVQLWNSTTIGSLTTLIIFICFWIYIRRYRAFLFSPPLDTCLEHTCKCSDVLSSQWFETINCLILR